MSLVPAGYIPKSIGLPNGLSSVKINRSSGALSLNSSFVAASLLLKVAKTTPYFGHDNIFRGGTEDLYLHYHVVKILLS